MRKIMKKKIIIISIAVIFLIVSLFPIKAHLDDGGSVIYVSVANVYEIKKIKSLGNEGMTITMTEGLSIKLFGKEVYYHIDKVYPVGQYGE